MNRRQFAGWVIATGVVHGGQVHRSALAAEATPTAEDVAFTCDLDLDFADLTIALEIPDEVQADQFERIESTLNTRLHALGWSSCSVDRTDRQILVNVQVPVDSDIDSIFVGELLSAAGRVDLVDGGEGHLEIGERITTSTHPLGPDSPEINVVYQAILTNLDFVSIEPEVNDLGEPVATIEITEDAAVRLAVFSSANVGTQMPLVFDGLVMLTPVIQGEIGSEFVLQPVDLITIEQLTVFTSGAPYPAPLIVKSFQDNRATPTA